MMTTSELVVGQNRLAFGLLKEHQLLDEADVVVRVYEHHGQQAHLKAQMRVPYARLEVVEQGKRVHVQPDGTRHVDHEATEVRGIDVAQVAFERPGTLAPRSHNLIGSDVQDLRQIDTSDPPDPRLHQVRIADAMAQGEPQVIVFATPKFCASRVCGPLVDMVRTLLPAHGDRVIFTHQEIWQDAAARKFFPTVAEWGLQTEPWIFVVDGEEIIRAKFEGCTTGREIEAALKPILASKEASPSAVAARFGGSPSGCRGAGSRLWCSGGGVPRLCNELGGSNSWRETRSVW